MKNENNEKEMNRGVGQALYRYLPNKWIDFYINKTRENYSAIVSSWHSDKLVEGNTERIIEDVWNIIDSYEPHQKIGFNATDNLSAWTVMEPSVREGSPSINAEISPLTFVCTNKSCKKIHSFNSSSYFLKDPNNKKCKACGSTLTQVRLIYFCECGWAGGVTPIPCSEHGYEYIIRKDSFNFACKKCGLPIPIIKKCPECGTLLWPHNVLDSSQYYSHSFSVIDLVDKDSERFVASDSNAPYLIIAYYLGFVTRSDLKDAIRNGLDENSKEQYKEDIEKQIKIIKDQVGDALPSDDIIALAKKTVDGSNSKTNKINGAIESVKAKMANNSIEHVKRIAITILEYDTILYAEEVSDLNKSIEMSKFLNTHPNPEVFKINAKAMGFYKVQASGKVPFVTATYGYSRKENLIRNNVKLRAFPEEIRGKTNIYAKRMETEGVLFEFDTECLIKWLLKNKIIDESILPNMDDKNEQRLWFLDNLDKSKIPFYENIDSINYEILSYIYKLIHTISHLLIWQLAELCGLDKNSMSEYIMPNIPAVFIYCQNAQGFSLGALFNAFEAHFNDWMSGVLNRIDNCVFDPICSEESGACLGCTFLNEVSCCHFNKDLDRRLLTGGKLSVNSDNKKEFIGFWEDIKWQ